MMPESDSDLFDTMDDRELVIYVARQLQRLEPLMMFFENPPPALAGFLDGNVDGSALPFGMSAPAEPLRKRG